MKKLFLLSISIGIAFSSVAQSNRANIKPTQKVKALTGDEPINQNAPIRPINDRKIQRSSAFSGTELGTTTYDQQTNAAMPKRILVYPDGKISVVYTYSKDLSAAHNSRGTGYVHFNGTSWSNAPTQRLEPAANPNPQNTNRSGWPNIISLADGKEVVIAHNAAAMLTATQADTSKWTTFNTNTGPGNTTWTRSYPLNNLALAKGAIWHRVANSGSNVYMLNNYSSLDRPQRLVDKVDNPMYYFRSTDNGATFSEIILPGYYNGRISSGDGDSYAIDAKDNVVAIVHGDVGQDVTVWKSVDFGATFTKTIIDSIDVPRLSDTGTTTDTNGDNIADTLTSGTSDVAIVIDNDLKVNAFYSITRIIKEDRTATGPGFFPELSNGIKYWKEGNNSGNNPIVGYSPDLVPEGETESNCITDIGTGYNNGRYGNSFVAFHPNASVDADGNIFMIYTAYTEFDTTDGGNNLSGAVGENYSDIYCVYSKDKGATWEPAKNLTGTFNLEEVYPSLAKRVDGNLHFTCQTDLEPGTSLNANANPPHPIGPSAITYYKIPLQELYDAPAAGKACSSLEPFNSIKAKKNALNLTAYPNPATDAITIKVNGTVVNGTVNVTNALGQVVLTQTINGNSTSIDLSNFANGIYNYSVITNNGISTAQFVVTK